MKYLLWYLMMLLSVDLCAQDCDPEQLNKKPGIWKAGIPGSIRNVTAADLAREKAILTAIHKNISSNFSPVGCQITYSNTLGNHLPAGENWVADHYYYSMYILRYLCNNNEPKKYYTDYSTPTTVTVAANVIHHLNTLYAANLPADERPYLKLENKPVKINGFYFMGEKVVGDSHLENKIKEYRWLITYNDTLPFSYVSRKEYLLIQKKRLEKNSIESPGDKKYNDIYLQKINDYLTKPEAELSVPAVCMWNDEERFNGFVEEGTKGSFIAIKPNLNYYRKKMPKSAPQFFSIVYKISHGDPVFEDNMMRIQKAIDFNFYRGMLGK